MLGSHFYNEAIRKTVVGFGTLFNNIEIQRKNPQNNNVLEVQKVPVAYGPKDKFLARIEQNPDPTPGAPYPGPFVKPAPGAPAPTPVVKPAPGAP